MMERYQQEALELGALSRSRANQNLQWMTQLIDEMLRQQLADNASVSAALPSIKKKVGDGTLTPVSAAVDIINMLNAKED